MRGNTHISLATLYIEDAWRSRRRAQRTQHPFAHSVCMDVKRHEIAHECCYDLRAYNLIAPIAVVTCVVVTCVFCYLFRCYLLCCYVRTIPISFARVPHANGRRSRCRNFSTSSSDDTGGCHLFVSSFCFKVQGCCYLRLLLPACCCYLRVVVTCVFCYLFRWYLLCCYVRTIPISFARVPHANGTRPVTCVPYPYVSRQIGHI